MDPYQEALRRYWHHDDFRGIQRQIVDSIAAGHDTFGLMPTGGGKSVTFQVPAVVKDGLCLVITPLIALMKDQVERLRSLGVRAEWLHGSMTRDEIDKILDNCIYNPAIKLLYVSPERLTSEHFLNKVQAMNLSFITVDEAHCILHWGFDFRPSYLQIKAFRESLPRRVPCLALTATATASDAAAIQHYLGFRNGRLYRMSFERPNLSYNVVKIQQKFTALVALLNDNPGPAIVYTRSREGAHEVAECLNAQAHVSATYYHAGLRQTDRNYRQQLWQEGRIRVMVATNAFGMGIDKSDVRLVVHLDVPDSIEAYFQEAGRAGRNGQPAKAIILWDTSDLRTLVRRVDEQYPPLEYIHRVYEDLACYYQIAVGTHLSNRRELSIEKLCTQFRHFPTRLLGAINLLDAGHYIHYEPEGDGPSCVQFTIPKERLYQLQHITEANERLIKALLRNYPGLFAQYVTIDEESIAQKLGTDTDHVYNGLKELNHAGILHYIPRKQVPYINFIGPRLDTDEVQLSDTIYAKRRARFAKQINAILTYLNNDTQCRSRQLLAHFGEKQAHPCGHCDVCRAEAEAQRHIAQNTAIESAIIALLSDGEPHPLSELQALPYPRPAIGHVLTDLQLNGEIQIEDSQITLA